MAEPESNPVNQQSTPPPPSGGGETVTPASQKKIKLFGGGKLVESGRVLPWLVLATVVGALGWIVMDAWSSTWQEVAVSQTPTASLNHRAKRPPAFADTSGWKTYRNSGYNGYEFKYPPNDALITGSELENKVLNASGYWGARGGVTEVAVIDSQSTFSVGRHGYIANLADCKKVTWPNDQTEELTTTKVINGITYYFGTYTGAAAGTQTRFNVYHAFGGSGGDGCFELVISASPSNEEARVPDKILSTFKFIK